MAAHGKPIALAVCALAAAVREWFRRQKAQQERADLADELMEAKEALAKAHAQLAGSRAEAARLRGDAAEQQGVAEELSDRLQAHVRDVRRYAGASALDFYDAVLTIPKLEDVYAPEKGWPVKVAQTKAFDLSGPLVGVRVVPLGHFSVGKTWLIGQLSGEELPRGVSVHTEGISVKAAAADKLSIVLLDTVGSNSPMDALPGVVDPASASHSAESVLQELSGQEEFLRQLCFEVGQVILLVIGQMSHKDQTDLVRLARAIRKERARKDIVVVHNLRDWDMDMLMQKSAKDGMSYVERNKTLFGLFDGSLEVTVGEETMLVIRHSGLFGGEGDSREAVVNIYHYYLTNELLPCSRNKFVIHDMKATITRTAGARRSLAQELAAAATKIQGRFASFSRREPVIVFDPNMSRFRVREPLPEGAVRMKPRDLGSYFAAGSDNPPYSITNVRCSAEISTGRGAARTTERQERWAYHMAFELPGLCAASLADIRAQFQRNGEQGALYREKLEGERGEQWTVSFQAELASIPGAHFQEVGRSTEGALGLSSDPAGHEIADSGSRPNFPDGIRTVKVTLRTGIMDYDTNEEPVVSYADGVLGITLLKQGRR